MGEWLHLADASTRAYLATPASGSGPGVLVLHAWWGLTPVFTDICDQLAASGYVALAPALFPGGATATTIPEAEALRDAHDEVAVVEPIVQAAATALRGLTAVTPGPLGVIGYSLGAYWALHLSLTRSEEIGATVIYYGTGGGDFRQAQAAYLGHFAEDDDFEPLEYVRSLEDDIRATGREVSFHIYPGTRHWFVEPNRPEYTPAAADLAWEQTLTFLQAHIG